MLKCLLAADNASIVRPLADYFMEKKYHLDIASDVEDAIKLLKENRAYQFVIIDINMPQKTGLDIYHYIKKNGITAKVIMMTGDLIGFEQLCGHLKIDARLEKPITINEFDQILKNLQKDIKESL
ncbi:MAG: hypothetical protein A2Z83_07510 [Omnitrophica bacterium GWA2_52_8]|nr:MAG: hypothetical protein A2Z83_07510 [Omnitrophica bacterium GWA2_52_8]